MTQDFKLDRRIWEWLKYIPIHNADSEIRATLRQYQKASERNEHPDIPEEILFWLGRCPLEEVPSLVRESVKAWQLHVRDFLAKKFTTSVSDGRLTITNNDTGSQFIFPQHTQ